MPAAVCGSKRSFFDDLPPSPPLSKRIRCSSSNSPIRFSVPSLLDQLRALFPLIENELLESALQECGNDLNAAIMRMRDFCLQSGEENAVPADGPNATAGVSEGVASVSEDPSAPHTLPMDGTGWVNFFVAEMMSATSPDDARSRAARVLDIFQKSITANNGVEDALQKENVLLKEQLEGILRENAILKHAVTIQHDRQKQYEDKTQELQHLKQLVSQYQEQVRTLEVNNYALAMHLKQAQQSSSIPGRFHPDVF